jgi:hypothetical protein
MSGVRFVIPIEARQVTGGQLRPIELPAFERSEVARLPATDSWVNETLES